MALDNHEHIRPSKASLSPYELLRDQKIEETMKMLTELGLVDEARQLSNNSRPSRKKVQKPSKPSLEISFSPSVLRVRFVGVMYSVLPRNFSRTGLNGGKLLLLATASRSMM